MAKGSKRTCMFRSANISAGTNSNSPRPPEEGRVRRFTPNEVERVQGFPDDWTRPSHFDESKADRIDSLRYHAVGNAVTPPVAEWVGRRLMSVLSSQDQEVLQASVAAE